MTAVGDLDVPPAAARGSITKSSISGGRKARDLLARTLIGAAVVVAVVPLGLVVSYVFSKGIGVILDARWFTEPIPRERSSDGFGMQPAIVGTLLITGMASLIAIPLGIMAAVYVNEYGGESRLARVIRFMADVMAGVPSIVMGLFIYAVFVLPRKEEGRQALAGALALACLMLPIIIRAVDGMLKLVPDELREASYALGTRKSRTILTVVLPAALPGITSGCLLAIARAAGETAPLVFTIGIVRDTELNPFKPNTALSTYIFSNAISPSAGAVERAWGAALTLILLVVLLSVIARIISARFTVR